MRISDWRSDVCSSDLLRPRGEHLAKALAGELDQFRADRRLDRGVARSPAEHAHFAEEAAGGEVAEEDRLAADILLDDHRSRADHIDIVALFALGQQDRKSTRLNSSH